MDFASDFWNRSRILGRKIDKIFNITFIDFVAEIKNPHINKQMGIKIDKYNVTFSKTRQLLYLLFPFRYQLLGVLRHYLKHKDDLW